MAGPATPAATEPVGIASYRAFAPSTPPAYTFLAPSPTCDMYWEYAEGDGVGTTEGVATAISGVTGTADCA